jgi:hypothetical protein
MRRVILYKTMIPHEIVARVWVEIVINAVLTFSKNVKIKIKIRVDKSIRRIFPVSLLVNHHQKITGITGRTHGARTESIPAMNESVMMRIIG